MNRSTYLRRRFGRSQALVNSREQALVRRLLDRAGPFGRILDSPCGLGRFTPQLRREARRVLVSGDRDAGRLCELRSAEPDGRSAHAIVRADLEGTLPFEDGAFDLVFNFRFFHHVRDPGLRSHVVGELARVAARHLIVSYYHPALLHLTYKRLRRHPGHALDLALLSRQSFRELFSPLGCTVVADRPVLPLVHASRVALLCKVPT